jgi:hypothetical protein
MHKGMYCCAHRPDRRRRLLRRTVGFFEHDFCSVDLAGFLDSTPLPAVETFFRAYPEINRIRLVALDYGNVVRVRHVTKSRFLDSVRQYLTNSQQPTDPFSISSGLCFLEE